MRRHKQMSAKRLAKLAERPRITFTMALEVVLAEKTRQQIIGRALVRAFRALAS